MRSILFGLLGMLSALAITLLSSPLQADDDFSARFEEIKKNATDAELYRFLYDLPKGGDLHNHMGGQNFPELWYQVACQTKLVHDTFYTRTKILGCPDSTEPLLYHITINQKEYEALSPARQKEYEPIARLDPEAKKAFLDDLWLSNPKKGRQEFFENIWPRFGAMAQNPYVGAELLVENMKLWSAEHVRYLETQALVFGTGHPQFLKPDGSEFPLTEALQIFRDRLKQRDAVATGVTVRFQSVILRFLPTAIDGVRDAYAFMDKNRDLMVGINMAGREDNEKGYPSQFLEVYREMRRQYSNLFISIHAGESDEPNFHIRDTLYLGATRIGHGVNLYTDPATMLLMRADGDLVEINLISNKLLEYTPDLTKHPFPDYLRFGVPVCLNTDDRGIYESDMTDEYFTAVRTYNLTWNEIVNLGRNSLVYSFAPPAVKGTLLESYKRDLASFTYRYDGSHWRQTVAQIKPTVTLYAQHEFHLHP